MMAKDKLSGPLSNVQHPTGTVRKVCRVVRSINMLILGLKMLIIVNFRFFVCFAFENYYRVSYQICYLKSFFEAFQRMKVAVPQTNKLAEYANLEELSQV